MSTVLQVITKLEECHITREQLETTRLGKYINSLRRKTTNDALARRAKNLLRKWREQILPETTAQSVPTSGGGIVIHPQPPKIYTPMKEGLSKVPDTPIFIDNDYVGGKMNGSRLPINYQNLSDMKRSSPGVSAKSKSTTGLPHNTSSNCSLPATMTNTTFVNKAGPISFANLLNRAEANKKASGLALRPEPPYANNLLDERSKSPASVPRLGKIPKKTTQSNTNHLCMESPLRSSQSQPVFTTIIDDDTVHQYDMQEHMRNMDRTRDKKSIGDNFLNVADNNSDSSSLVCASTAMGGLNNTTITITNASETTGDSKRKHKKHKKEKKKKKSSKNCLDADTMPTLELPESLSNSSISLCNSTNNPNKVVVPTGVVTTFPAIAAVAKPSEFSFIGKFSKTDETVINIDSSSCSNSPKYDSFSNKSALRRNLSPPLAADITAKLLSQNDRQPEPRYTDEVSHETSLARLQATAKPIPSADSLSQVKMIPSPFFYFL